MHLVDALQALSTEEQERLKRDLDFYVSYRFPIVSIIRQQLTISPRDQLLRSPAMLLAEVIEAHEEGERRTPKEWRWTQLGEDAAEFLRDEEGQTTVEYLLIIAVIVVVISVLGKGLQKQLPKTIETVFSGVNDRINSLMKGAAN